MLPGNSEPLGSSKTQNYKFQIPISNDNPSPHPSPLGDCVVIERPRGEAVGFQSLRMRVFKVWETSVGLKSNVFIGLPTLNQNG
jgi:hypothetical protein